MAFGAQKKVSLINNREHYIGIPTGERLNPGITEIPLTSLEKCKGLPCFQNLIKMKWVEVVKPDEDKLTQSKDLFKEMSFEEAKNFLKNEENSDILIEVYPMIKQKSLKKLVRNKLDLMGV